MIVFPIENLSNGQLNTVMSCIGSVIGPADGLFKVIGALSSIALPTSISLSHFTSVSLSVFFMLYLFSVAIAF